jgi:hypothetical protein
VIRGDASGARLPPDAFAQERPEGLPLDYGEAGSGLSAFPPFEHPGVQFHPKPAFEF